jgi:AsmA protein
LKLDGKAGPINANDAAMTPFKAQATVKKLDLAASGFVDPGTGIAGVADYSGNVSSDGKTIRTDGTMTADKLKLSPKGTPASKAVQLKYATNYDVASQSGTLTKGDVTLGKALAQLTGTYKTQGETTLLNMKLNAQNMPVDDLTTMLPALGVVLPSGSSLKGGTLTTNLDIAGPADKLVITGPIRLADTRLAGFDMGSKMSAITKLTGGGKSGSDTVIQNLSTNARVAPEGIRTDAVNLVVPSLGTVVGAGTISPEGALNYKMSATLSGGAAQTAGQLTQLAGIKGGGSAGLPFFIQGTTSNPQFVPDVQGMAQSQVKGALGGVLGNGKQKGSSPTDALGGIFGKKKKN